MRSSDSGPSRLTPPRLAVWVLAKVLSPRTREYLLGDLEERYRRWSDEGMSRWKAALGYWVQVFAAVRVSVGERSRSTPNVAVTRSRSRGDTMYAILKDCRYAVRSLIARPGFALIAIGTLALGIGANTAIFSVMRSVLLLPFPYQAPEELVAVGSQWQEVGVAEPGGHGLSIPEWMDFRQSEAFADLGVFTDDPVSVARDDQAERVTAGFVSANLLPILGVPPLLGRWFSPEEDLPNGPRVAILSFGLWQRLFAGDSSVIGNTVLVDQEVGTIVGVMPEGFRSPRDYLATDPTQIFLPLQANTASTARGSHFLNGVARVRSGLTVAQVNADLEAISTRLIAMGAYQPESNYRGVALTLSERLIGDVDGVVMVLYAAVGLLLLIACANVANLLLVQAEGRRRELAVRRALGAGKIVLLRQLLTESLLLSVVGGVVGVVVGWIGLQWLVSIDSTAVPRLAEVRLDGTVLSYVAGISIITGLFFGIAPVWQAGNVDVQASLKQGTRGTTGGYARHRVQRTLVAVQMALAVLLTIGAGLTIRSFAKLSNIDPGFVSSDILTLQMSLASASYPTAEDVALFYERTIDGIRGLPSVIEVGAVRVLPLAGHIGDWSIRIDGRTPGPGEDFDGDWQIATPGYLEAMRIPLVAGRLFDRNDRADGHQVAVINETMANYYWPAGDALGQRISMNGPESPWVEIVGVVGDVRHNGLSAPVNSKWYRPHEQARIAPRNTPRSMTLVVRTAGDPLAMVSPIRSLIGALDPQIPLASIRALDDVLTASLARPRFTMTLLSVFGAVALVLAAIGVYGVVSYSVAQRTGELGLRRALGATGGAIVGVVLRHGVLMSVVGVVLGMAGAVWATRFMNDLVYDVSVRDAMTFVTVPVLLILVAFVASLVPARRAVAVEPIRSLRDD